ncbi:MAG: DUF5320 domain-containing protein [bacterium]
MPGRDGTGPMGYGPRTGGGFGWCPPVTGAPTARPVYGVGRGGIPWGGGRGRAWGGGRGYGWRHAYPYADRFARPYYGPPTGGYAAGDEASFLRDRVQDLEEELKAVKDRLQEVESPAAK